MKTFFIEKSRKNSIIGKLRKIEKKDNKIIIYSNLEKLKPEKILKLAEKIKRILIKENTKQVAFQKDLKNEKYLTLFMQSFNIKICSSKWLFKKLTNEVIENVLKEKQKQETDIFICVNEMDNTIENFIYHFAREFKTLNIITNHIGRFKTIEEKLYDEGIIITVTNNKRKSLAKSKLIINFDFPNEILNQFVIFEEAIIISWEEDIKIYKKRFNGTIISDYEYTFEEKNEVSDFIEKNELHNFDERDICQVLNCVPKGILKLTI